MLDKPYLQDNGGLGPHWVQNEQKWSKKGDKIKQLPSVISLSEIKNQVALWKYVYLCGVIFIMKGFNLVIKLFKYFIINLSGCCLSLLNNNMWQTHVRSMYYAMKLNFLFKWISSLSFWKLNPFQLCAHDIQLTIHVISWSSRSIQDFSFLCDSVVMVIRP